MQYIVGLFPDWGYRHEKHVRIGGTWKINSTLGVPPEKHVQIGGTRVLVFVKWGYRPILTLSRLGVPPREKHVQIGSTSESVV